MTSYETAEVKKVIESVIFKNQGQQLVGILHIPDELKSGEKAPGIVMFHGFTGNKTEAHRLFVHLARNLCDSGFVVLRFDFRGSGDSDGEFEDMTVPEEESDAREALSFLVEQRWVDREKVGILGLSMGGRVASILASKDKRVRFVILFSPALGPLRERFLSNLDKETLGRLDSGEAIRTNYKNGWYLKKPFFDTLDYLVPFDVMNKIKIPILIVHSDQDEVLSIEEARKGYEIVKNLNEKNKFYMVKGGDHTFSEKEHTLKVINVTREWLKFIG